VVGHTAAAGRNRTGWPACTCSGSRSGPRDLEQARPRLSTKVGGIEVETGAIPLGYVSGRPTGVAWTADAGHIAVVGPTRSGKGLHLTDTLIRWPGPVVCVDPKGEQRDRTAAFRLQAYGPVFRIPPQGLDLGELYRLDQDLDLRELHEVLMRPWRDGKDRIFADKAFPLFTAAVQYGRQVDEHPLAVLARWAQDSPVNAGFSRRSLWRPRPFRSSQMAWTLSGSARTGSR
jgi:hypothetical protein